MTGVVKEIYQDGIVLIWNENRIRIPIYNIQYFK
jgi:hypothetical protein